MSGGELSFHPGQVEIDVFDLALREILRQQAGTQCQRSPGEPAVMNALSPPPQAATIALSTARQRS
jgi:hypothetical protein